MSAARSLYERVRAHVGKEASGMSLARASVQTRQGPSPSYSIPVPVEKPQVTTSTFCPHVEGWLAEWYAENSKVVCARCWVESRGR